MCKLENYTGKSIGNVSTGFETWMDNRYSESRIGIPNCKFSRHVYKCGIKNRNLIEPFFW